MTKLKTEKSLLLLIKTMAAQLALLSLATVAHITAPVQRPHQHSN
jgi:hypothetical protein